MTLQTQTSGYETNMKRNKKTRNATYYYVTAAQRKVILQSLGDACLIVYSYYVEKASAQLGSEADKVQLREHIEYKRRQEKEVSSSARSLLINEILPEHDRQMRMIGVAEKEIEGAAYKALPASKVVNFDAEKIAREVAWYATNQEGAVEYAYHQVKKRSDEHIDRPVRVTAGLGKGAGLW